MKLTVNQAAEQIAEILASCDTDFRGDMLWLVARDLRQKHHQFFTATCLDAASLMYGTSKERLEDVYGQAH